MLLGTGKIPTEEIGFRILEALKAESKHAPRDVFKRRPMQEISRDLMERHGWDELDFGRGWSLLIDEKLMDSRKKGDKFYAWPTEAGRDFLRAHNSGRKRNSRRKIYATLSLIFIFAVVCLILRHIFDMQKIGK